MRSKSEKYQRELALLDRALPMGRSAPFGSPILGAIRLGFFLFYTLLLVPLQFLILNLMPSRALFLPRLYHRTTAKVMGLRMKTRGKAAQGKNDKTQPTLFVANHASYLDVVVLGSLLDASFVAKADIADWPFFGMLSKLQRTIFIDRKRGSTHRQRDDIGNRLRKGDNLILFPEGTSSNGSSVLPFRSALFSVLESGETPITVQPVSVSYTKINGMPIGRDYRPLVAWYGTMELLPHLWNFAGLGRVEIIVEFHPPVRLRDFSTRKELARHCGEIVAKGVATALHGGEKALSRH